MCTTQGAPSTWAAMLSKIGRITSQVLAGPPGMMAGPLRAPSSPPDTPAPTKRRPRPDNHVSRRSVSVYRLLPPSMMMSPASMNGKSDSITASTAAPALTMIMTLRGRASEATKSPKVCAPVRRLPTWAARNSSVTVAVRLNTLTLKPRLSTFSTKFWPITARPMRPKSLKTLFMAGSIGRSEGGRDCAVAPLALAPGLRHGLSLGSAQEHARMRSIGRGLYHPCALDAVACRAASAATGAIQTLYPLSHF